MLEWTLIIIMRYTTITLDTYDTKEDCVTMARMTSKENMAISRNFESPLDHYIWCIPRLKRAKQ